MSLQELQVVTSVLRRLPALEALHHLVPIVSSFLGPDPTLSLSRACELGSIELLECMWKSSCTSATDRSPRWSLTNYLRSDPHYYRWQFAEALEVAAGRGDLAAVEWLFTHFSGCLAPVDVVEAAAGNGHEHILDYLLEHDAGAAFPYYLGGAMGFDEAYLPDDWSGPGNAVTWGGHSMLYAVENKHVDVAIWLYERSAHGLGIDNNNEEEAGRIIQAALATGFTELSAKIMARHHENWDDWLLEYSLDCPVPQFIELMLEKRYFQVFEQSGRRALLSLARTGHLELLQRVLQVYDPIPTDDLNWKYNWLSALTDACKNGHLLVIQFMMEHPMGHEAMKLRRPELGLGPLLRVAAEQDSTNVLEYLFSQGITDPKDEALKIMARLGKLPLVQWVVEHVVSTPKRSIRPILSEAATTGQVEILRYLLDLDPSRAPGYNFDPVYPGVMESVAFFGQLDTIQWLSSRGFGCSQNTMEHAARAGHLDIVKWLHAHAKVECTTETMDSAAGSGQLDVVKWLYKNQPNGCSPKGFDDAVEFNHARVAFLLHGHYPDHIPVEGRLPSSIADNFDMLLFLYDHYPAIFTAKAVAKARYHAVDLCTKTSSSEIRGWLGKLETSLLLEVAERSLESLRTDNGGE